MFYMKLVTFLQHVFLEIEPTPPPPSSDFVPTNNKLNAYDNLV